MSSLTNPKVSVIVPCYNFGHLLQETLESLQRQTFLEWECIVIDDGSTDNTSAVANSFVTKDPRYVYIFQENAGLSAARNTGINAARGAFIQLLDADDFLGDEKLLEHYDILSNRTDIDIVYSEVRYFKSNQPDIHYYTLNGGVNPWMVEFKDHEQFCFNLIEQNLFAVNCAFYRKSIVNDCGLFNTKLKSVEDWEFWIRCAIAGKRFLFKRDEKSIALVRIHNSSMSNNLKRMHEASLLARYGLRKILNTSSLQIKIRLIEINEAQIKYLHRKIYSEYSSNGYLKKIKHLFLGYPFQKEWRFIGKEILNVIRTNKKHH